MAPVPELVEGRMYNFNNLLTYEDFKLFNGCH